MFRELIKYQDGMNHQPGIAHKSSLPNHRRGINDGRIRYARTNRAPWLTGTLLGKASSLQLIEGGVRTSVAKEIGVYA